MNAAAAAGDASPLVADGPAAVARPTAGPAAVWRPSHNPWVVALTVTLATFMEVLDTSIANVALPHMAGSLSSTTHEATWVLTSYLVANAIVLPLSAWLSRLVGRKRFYMTCVAIFTVSSALCGLAPSLGWLIVFRILQGAGGGGLQPSEQAILADTFEPAKRGMAFAVYGVAVVSAPALGPTLGGWITDNFSWRWVFYLNVPVGILSLVLSRWVVEDPPHERAERAAKRGSPIDGIGLGLVTLGLGCLQVVLDKGQEDDWFESRFIVVFAVLAALGLAAAIVWELRQRDPIVDLRLLGTRAFGTAFTLMFALGFALLGSTVLLPIFLQTVMGYTAMQSGMALTGGALTIMALMPLVGTLVTRVQPRWLILFGLLMSSYALFRLTHLSLDSTFGQVAFDRVVQGVGLAFLFVPINTVAFATVPPGKNNSASSLINLARNVGASVGISIVTTILARRAQVHQAILAAHVNPFDTPAREALARFTTAMLPHGASVGIAHDRALTMIAGEVGRQASVLAVLDAFRFMSLALLLVAPLALMVARVDPHGARATGH